MIIGFQSLVWLPRPFSDPHQLISWAGNAQNLAIAGAAWIVIDYLTHSRAAFDGCRGPHDAILNTAP
jgi:hypothetical protein